MLVATCLRSLAFLELQEQRFAVSQFCEIVKGVDLCTRVAAMSYGLDSGPCVAAMAIRMKPVSPARVEPHLIISCILPTAANLEKATSEGFARAIACIYAELATPTSDTWARDIFL